MTCICTHEIIPSHNSAKPEPSRRWSWCLRVQLVFLEPFVGSFLLVPCIGQGQGAPLTGRSLACNLSILVGDTFEDAKSYPSATAQVWTRCQKFWVLAPKIEGNTSSSWKAGYLSEENRSRPGASWGIIASWVPFATSRCNRSSWDAHCGKHDQPLSDNMQVFTSSRHELCRYCSCSYGVNLFILQRGFLGNSRSKSLINESKGLS